MKKRTSPSWDFQLDTTKLANLEYTINVKAFDGTNYSEDTILDLTVNNEEEGDGDDGEAGFILGFEIAGLVVALGVGIFSPKKKR